MFDGVSQRLTTWATTLGAGAVVFTGDAPQDGTPAARLSLLAILPYPPPRTLTRAPLRFRLRYLVTCPSTMPEAQTLLGRLLVSALQEPDVCRSNWATSRRSGGRRWAGPSSRHSG